jgi:hypothetical protein
MSSRTMSQPQSNLQRADYGINAPSFIFLIPSRLVTATKTKDEG